MEDYDFNWRNCLILLKILFQELNIGYDVQGRLTVNYRYTHREFQLKLQDSFKRPVTSFAGENVNKRRQIAYALRWEGVLFCHKCTIVY